MIPALILLQLLDALTTYVALRRPGLVESNGLLRSLMERIGVVPTLIVTKGLFIALVLALLPYMPEWGLWVLASLS